MPSRPGPTTPSGRGLTTSQGGSLNANPSTVTYTPGATTTVTNALGVTDTYTLTTLQGVPKITGISRAATGTTAAATETLTYDANGYVRSRTDWNGNETSYTNNAHGMPTSIVEAVGSAVARTTTIAYDPDLRASAGHDHVAGSHPNLYVRYFRESPHDQTDRHHGDDRALCDHGPDPDLDEHLVKLPARNIQARPTATSPPMAMTPAGP